MTKCYPNIVRAIWNEVTQVIPVPSCHLPVWYCVLGSLRSPVPLPGRMVMPPTYFLKTLISELLITYVNILHDMYSI